jgi:hypothetical protein
VTGTVSTTDSTPLAEAVFQKDVPPRVEKTLGGSVGIRPQRNFGGCLRIMLKSGK